MDIQYETQRLDHLGIVAGICQQIQLVERIDALLPESGHKVSVGQAVLAMVLNGLGFVGRALYLMPEFFENKPVDLLIGEGLTAADFNSDSLGKALDRLYDFGVTEVFAAVSAHALRVCGIGVRFVHGDTTAFSLEGEYEREEGADDGEAQPIHISYGHSKDHRPDLKQAILGLVCNEDGIPLYLRAQSGNTSDKTSLPTLLQDYRAQLSATELEPILVADDALYSAESVQSLSALVSVTRVPVTLNAVKTLLADLAADDFQPTGLDGYRAYETRSSYSGIEQRWLVVESRTLAHAERQALDKRITLKRDALDTALKALERQVFYCHVDALAAVNPFTAQWTFHTLRAQATSHTRYAHFDRPTPDTPTRTEWQLTLTVDRNDEAIAHHQRPLGRYVLATNLLDEARLTIPVWLALYKAQNTTVERGFRFLKDPLFYTHSLFLTKPSRIMALLMVMGLSLLLYTLAEHRMRQQLLAHDQTIPDQKGKPTQRPTLRRVFQMFEGISVLVIDDGQQRRRLLTNLNDLHLQIAALLGEYVLKFYRLSENRL